MQLFKVSASEEWKFHKSGHFWVDPPSRVLQYMGHLCSDSVHHEKEHETPKSKDKNKQETELFEAS